MLLTLHLQMNESMHLHDSNSVPSNLDLFVYEMLLKHQLYESATFDETSLLESKRFQWVERVDTKYSSCSRTTVILLSKMSSSEMSFHRTLRSKTGTSVVQVERSEAMLKCRQTKPRLVSKSHGMFQLLPRASDLTSPLKSRVKARSMQKHSIDSMAPTSVMNSKQRMMSQKLSKKQPMQMMHLMMRLMLVKKPRKRLRKHLLSNSVKTLCSE